MQIPLDMLVGTRHTIKSGELEILKYISSSSVVVQFINTGYITTTRTTHIRSGSVKDKLLPAVYGAGYMGEGKYSSTFKGKTTKVYSTWLSMLRRCYCQKEAESRPTYQDCSVCVEWCNFQVFAEWWTENYKEGYELDKDIKIKGNKVYSPDTCLFIPQELNKLFSAPNPSKSKYPVGVTTQQGKYRAQLKYSGVKTHIGMYSTPELASNAYQLARLNKLKDIVESNIYKDLTQFIGQHI